MKRFSKQNLFAFGCLMAASALVVSRLAAGDDTATTKPAVAVAEPTTGPVTMATPAMASPATTMPMAAAATVDSTLIAVDKAYGGLQSFTFDGQISGHFEVGTVSRNETASFQGSFTSPNKFKHDATDVMLTSDGTKLFSFLKDRSVYQTMKPPKARAAAADWPPAAVSILEDQDPSLLLAITPSAKAQLKSISTGITLVPGDAPTLAFAGTDDKPGVTMTFDPGTMLLKKAVFDYRHVMTKAGTADVKTAEVTVSYSNVTVAAPADPQMYAWAPPTDAAEVSTASTSIDAGNDAGVGELVGKPAPDFTLNDLKGNPVKLSSLKGSVVVIDLWATWCGPCKASLPGLDKMYQDLGPKGLQFYAVDLKEDQATVEKLLKKMGWTFPVLLDGEGAVAKKYHCNGIPQTMVISKDGTVKKVFVGSGHDEEVVSLVNAEMKK